MGRPGQPPGQAELEAAIKAAKNNQLDDAIALCQKAIERNPQLEHAYLLHGSACAMKEDIDCEKGAYARGLKALPKSVALKKAMALVHLGKSDYPAAIELLKEANDLSDGKDAELLADLAYAHIFVDEVAAGEELAKQSVALDAKCFQCAMALGEVSLAGRKYDQAVTAYASAAQLVPEEAAPRQKRARATYLSGKKVDGLAQYATELERAPDDLAFRFEYIKVLMDAKKPKAAIPHLQKLLESSPDEPNLLQLLLKAQTQAKDRKGAKKTKQKLKKLKGN